MTTCNLALPLPLPARLGNAHPRWRADAPTSTVRTLEVRMSDSSLLPVFVSTTPLRSILGLASPMM